MKDSYPTPRALCALVLTAVFYACGSSGPPPAPPSGPAAVSLETESTMVFLTERFDPRDFAGEARGFTMATSRMKNQARADSFARIHDQPEDENYARIVENEFRSPRVRPRSTFAVDVDRASYANVRRFLTQGQRPPPDAVRIDELINYFPYDYPATEGSGPLSIATEVAPAPWEPEHYLLRIGLHARDIDLEDLPPSHLVFLIDVSGSMASANKLPLLQSALRLLVEQLRPSDRVSIVVYAGAAGLVLEPTSGARRQTILNAIDRLRAGGSTAGGAGLRLAYDLAREHYIEGGNNRVVLATDGDFNVGASSDAAMVRLIEEEREHGVFLSVLGFGQGNLQDAKMEQIADHGNGNYAYIDDLWEARKTLVDEFGATMHAVAKDVKIQVEFNPLQVSGYRLIGYENRRLAVEDFEDDEKDAGEMGSGHTVTALYQIVPARRADGAVRIPSDLRYQRASAVV